MSKADVDAEEIVAVVPGGSASAVFHKIEDGETGCTPSRLSHTLRRVERAALSNHFRPCRTCYGLRSDYDTDPLGGKCPFCGQQVVYSAHLPECEQVDEYFEGGVG